MNLATALDEHRAERPDGIALIWEDRTWTWSELVNLVDRCARGLSRIGVGPGERVCLFLGNGPVFVFAHLACQKLGAVCVSIASECKVGEVAYRLRDSRGSVLVTERARWREVPPPEQLAGLRSVVAADGPFGDLTWEGLLQRGSGDVAAVDLPPSAPVSIIYTSGTTGEPKGVVLTHGNLVFHSRSVCDTTGLDASDRVLCFLPLYHSFAQNFILNACVYAGATVVLQHRFRCATVLDAVRRHRVTRLCAVPPVYVRLLEEGTGDALGSLRYCFSAASPLPTAVRERWRKRVRLPIHEGYGLTETSPLATYNHTDRIRPGTVGTAIPGVGLKIVDEQGAALPVGHTGEICIRGPNEMAGYFGKPLETRQVLQDGWLHTGDVGHLDAGGYLTLVDRLKDMINSGGLKIWPREVEEVIYTHPNVAECALIGVPHPTFGETPVALVVLRQPGRTDEKEIVGLCLRHLADYKAPRRVEFVRDLPKNATGKILKRQLRQSVY